MIDCKIYIFYEREVVKYKGIAQEQVYIIGNIACLLLFSSILTKFINLTRYALLIISNSSDECNIADSLRNIKSY